MKVLVAGGAGFIGSNLVARLLRQGHEVAVVDNLLTGSRTNVPGTAIHRLDCASPRYLEAYKGGGWDLVVHLAGASSAPLFDERPSHAAEAVAAFQNSLEVARACGAKVAFASTSSLYARSPKPFREDMHVIPGTLYEFSKHAMEGLAQAYHLRHGIETTAFRFFSVYGPNEQAKGRFANVVTQFSWAIRRGEQPVVYGDGTQTRDFTHVDDVLGALELCVRKSQGFQVYNIGTGIEHTFNDVVRMLNEALGTDVPPRYVPNPVPNYVAETLADTQKLRALGWRPTVELREGIERLVREPLPVEAKARVRRLRAK